MTTNWMSRLMLLFLAVAVLPWAARGEEVFQGASTEGLRQSVDAIRFKAKTENPEVWAELQNAITRNDLALIARILAAGASPDSIPDDHVPPVLWYLAMHMPEQPVIVALLLQHGANPNAYYGGRGKSGISVLSEAAATGNATTVDLLLGHGADPNARSFVGDKDTGITPLMAACLGRVKGWTEVDVDAAAHIIESLVDAGADVNATQNGETVLEFAEQTKQDRLIKLLKDKGAR